MKFAFLLVVSLAVGIAAGACLRRAHAVHRPPPFVAKVTRFVTNTVNLPLDQPFSARKSQAGSSKPLHWRQLETSDLRQFVANLRAVGCPEQTIRDIVGATINRQYTGRIAALMSQAEPIRYWKKDPWKSPQSDPETQKQLTQIEAEKERLLTDLLGPNVLRANSLASGDDTSASLETYPGLSPEKRKAVNELRQQFDEDRERISAELKGAAASRVQELNAALKGVNAREREALARCLTSAELDGFDMWESDTARRLRSSLSGFQPTEDEFRRICQLQRKLDDEFGMQLSSSGSPSESEKWNAAQQEKEAALREELGPERFAAYKRLGDRDYAFLINSMNRLNLAPDVPDKVWAIRESVLGERTRLLAQSNLTWEEQQIALRRLASQTRQSVAEAMGGESVMNRYEGGPGFNWLKELTKPDRK